MKESNLFSDKTTISISVVKLQNQKINKTTFNQLLISSPFDWTFKLKDDVNILGFVNDKERYMLWGDGNSIYKCSLVRIVKFARFDLEEGKVKDFLNLYSDRNIEYFNGPGYEREMDIDSMEEGPVYYILNAIEKEEILNKQAFIKELLFELNQRQVFFIAILELINITYYIMPHEFQWNKAKTRKIELLLPRLKYSVYPTNM